MKCPHYQCFMELLYACRVKRWKHSKPHVHALYGEEEIVVSLNGEVLEGKFPNRQLKMLLAWMTIHEDELYANWKMLSEGEGYFRIAPLK